MDNTFENHNTLFDVLKPFVEGGYFKGELYLDTRRSCYRNLDFHMYIN